MDLDAADWIWMGLIGSGTSSWQGVFAYCILKEGAEETADLVPSLKAAVRQQIGGLATPDFIVCTPGLPKTRSGKIMRRVGRHRRTRSDRGPVPCMLPAPGPPS